jgi:hypothetical protein
MNDEVAAGLAEGLAELVRLVPAPIAPLGYGVDLHCTTDIRDDHAEADPFSTEGIAEAIFRRWTTNRGANPDDPDYGHNVTRMLNRGMTQAELAAESGMLRSEAEKDERVDRCEVSVVVSNGGRDVRVSSKVYPLDPEIEPFPMVVAVVDGQALLDLQG